MQLRIVDYSKNPQLAEAIRRYYTILQMIFESNVYKVFETPHSQIHRILAQQVGGPVINNQRIARPKPAPGVAGVAEVTFVCGKCKLATKLQANLGKALPIKPGSIPFPKDNKFVCPGCKTEHNVSNIRKQLEGQFGQGIFNLVTGDAYGQI
jgi:hypothetical protein